MVVSHSKCTGKRSCLCTNCSHKSKKNKFATPKVQEYVVKKTLDITKQSKKDALISFFKTNVSSKDSCKLGLIQKYVPSRFAKSWHSWSIEQQHEFAHFYLKQSTFDFDTVWDTFQQMLKNRLIDQELESLKSANISQKQRKSVLSTLQLLMSKKVFNYLSNLLPAQCSITIHAYEAQSKFKSFDDYYNNVIMRCANACSDNFICSQNRQCIPVLKLAQMYNRNKSAKRKTSKTKQARSNRTKKTSKTKAKPKSTSKSKTKSKAKPRSKPKSKSKSQAKPRSKPKSKSTLKSKSNPKSKSKSKSKSKPRSKPKSKSKPRSKPKPRSKSKPRSKKKPRLTKPIQVTIKASTSTSNIQSPRSPRKTLCITSI